MINSHGNKIYMKSRAAIFLSKKNLNFNVYNFLSLKTRKFSLIKSYFF